jgi:hypothetical protein
LRRVVAFCLVEEKMFMLFFLGRSRDPPRVRNLFIDDVSRGRCITIRITKHFMEGDLNAER